MTSDGLRTALVIGHRGQDGALLVQRLRADGYRVVGVGRPDRPCTADDRVADVADPVAVTRLVEQVGPDEIYYVAAHHGSSEKMAASGPATDVTAAWAVNVAGPANVLNAVQQTGGRTRLLLASTCMIHAPSAGRIDERAPLAPDTLYGMAKAAALLLAREYRRNGLPVWGAVLFPHESGNRHPSFVASRVIRGALAIEAGAADTVTVGDPSAVVDWSLASAVVDGMVRMVRFTEPADYVLASGEGRTVGEFASTALAALDLEPERHLRTDPSLLARPSARRVGNPSQFRALTGWNGRPPFEKFVSTLIDEHRAALAQPGEQFKLARAVEPDAEAANHAPD